MSEENKNPETRVRLTNVRLSFPDLFEPRDFQGDGKFKFGGTFLLPKTDSNQLKQIVDAMLAAAKEKWGDKAEVTYKSLKNSGKLPLGDGDLKEELEGYAGNFVIRASSKSKPRVIDRDRSELTAADGIPYSGSFVNASIDFWAQDNAFGKRINAQLRGVQFYKNGDAFSGGARPADVTEFEDLSVEEADASDLY